MGLNWPLGPWPVGSGQRGEVEWGEQGQRGGGVHGRRVEGIEGGACRGGGLFPALRLAVMCVGWGGGREGGRGASGHSKSCGGGGCIVHTIEK